MRPHVDQRLYDQLRASEERFKSLVEQLPAGVYMSTLERVGQFVYLSPQAERILGYTLSDFDATPTLYADLIHPEDRDYVVRKSKKAVDKLKGYSLEYRILREDGTTVWIRDEGHIIFDRHGSPEVLQGVLFNITLEKQEETERRTLLRAVEQSPNVIVVTDRDARIEYVNPAFEVVTGYRADEVLGENPRILKSGIHPEEFYREMWDTLTENRVWRAEVCNKKKDGTLYWEDNSISPVTGPENRITHYIAIKRDITEEKELERIREDVERISRHDLKTPLGGIIGLPQLLLEDGNLTEKQKEYVKLIEESGRKMLNLLNRSVDLLKMERGHYEYSPVKINIVEILKQLIGDNDTLIRKKKLKVKWIFSRQQEEGSGEETARKQQEAFGKNPDEADIEPVFVEGEELLTYTMCGNVLVNALEASPKEGEIRIEIEEGVSDKYVRVSIRNRGEVPKEVRDNFFDKYVTYGKRTGTGIGTYSAKLSAEVQGGDIQMESSSGSTVVQIRLNGAGSA
ncbi:MAG: PAS domain S-box protein [Spirochaetaceae bacterium]